MRVCIKLVQMRALPPQRTVKVSKVKQTLPPAGTAVQSADVKFPKRHSWSSLTDMTQAIIFS